MKVIKVSSIDALTVDQEGAVGVTVRRLINERNGAPNFYMRLFEVQPGGNTPFHTHDWEHEVYVLSGSGKLVRENEQEDFNSGDAIWVPPNEKHQFRNDADQILKFLCLIPSKGSPK